MDAGEGAASRHDVGRIVVVDSRDQRARRQFGNLVRIFYQLVGVLITYEPPVHDHGLGVEIPADHPSIFRTTHHHGALRSFDNG